MFHIGKILQELCWPLAWALLALAVLTLLSYRRKQRRLALLGLFAFLYLLLASLPLVSGLLRQPLEAAAKSLPIDEYPDAEAIVVLGGTAMRAEPPHLAAEEAHGNRLLWGSRLYHRKKAPIVVVTGGNPYDTVEGPRTEADDMRDILVDMGVPKAAVVLESRARNTAENAHYTAELLGARGISRILLVTSAFHMRRSLGHFRSTALSITPVPCGRESGRGGLGWRSFVPSAEALFASTLALKEVLGQLAVR